MLKFKPQADMQTMRNLSAYLTEVLSNQLEMLLLPHPLSNKHTFEAMRNCVLSTALKMSHFDASIIKRILLVDTTRLSLLINECNQHQIDYEYKALILDKLPTLSHQICIDQLNSSSNFIEKNIGKNLLATLYANTQFKKLDIYLTQKIQDLSSTTFIDFIRYNFPNLIKWQFYLFKAELYEMIAKLTNSEMFMVTSELYRNKSLTLKNKYKRFSHNNSIEKKLPLAITATQPYKALHEEFVADLFYTIHPDFKVNLFIKQLVKIYDASLTMTFNGRRELKSHHENYIFNIKAIVNSLTHEQLLTILDVMNTNQELKSTFSGVTLLYQNISILYDKTKIIQVYRKRDIIEAAELFYELCQVFHQSILELIQHMNLDCSHYQLSETQLFDELNLDQHNIVLGNLLYIAKRWISFKRGSSQQKKKSATKIDVNQSIIVAA